MSAVSYTLLLRLEGPMQSWGFRSRFVYRDTALEPTRSGIIGLVCAAMGIGREEDISRFDCLRFGVRVECEGRVERDYHTALEVIKADATGTDTVLSHRDYLADASFTVGLESDNLSLLQEIEKALRNPVWFLYLGRKSFPLTRPPLEPEDAIRPGGLEKHLLSGPARKRVVLEAQDGERLQQDWPLSFVSLSRRFKPRIIKTLFTTGEGR